MPSIKILILKKFILIFFVFFLIISASQAQTIPSVASPDRTLKIPDSLSQSVNFQTNGNMVLPDIAELPTPENIEGFIELKGVVFKGVSVYSAQILSSLYKDLLDKVIHISEVYGIANQLTALYHADGYALSQAFIPGQEIQQGIVEVWVVEGNISTYQIKGDAGDNNNVISRYADQILKSSPLKTKDLERYLLLMNDLPGIKVSGYIVPGQRGLKDAELILQTTIKKTGGYIGFDNRGSDYFGQDQLYLNLQANGALGFGELIELSPMINGIDDGPESLGGFFNIRAPVASDGAYFQTYLAYSKTKPGGKLEDFDLRGEALIATMAYGYPIIRERGRYLYLTGQFDVIETKEDVYKNHPFIEDSLRVFRVNLSYGKADSFDGETFIDLKFSGGIDAFGATNDSDELRSRSNADSSFAAYRLSAARRQSLDKIISDLRLFLGVDAQYSAQPLLSEEEFGLGGPVYLQGYDYYELSGDYGLMAKVELQYDIENMKFMPFDSAELFVFYDIGKIWNHNPIEYELSNGSLASAGGGLRMTFHKNVLGSFYVAQPLTREVFAEDDKDLRYFFQLAYTW